MAEDKKDVFDSEFTRQQGWSNRHETWQHQLET